MKSAIMSKIDLNDKNNKYSIEFNRCVEELIDLPDVMKLENFFQHLNTSRLQHSVNVAYYSYLICKAFGWDYRSAARGGLLHDLFLYDWRQEKQPEGHHAKAHPLVALKNAKKNVELNAVEEDIIVKHMWPVTVRAPKYKEAFVVSFVDKYCACCEVYSFYHMKLSFTISILKYIRSGGVFAR